MNPQTETPPTSLRIWQQNLNKSIKAQYDLINPLIHNNWDIILLQEPYTDSLGNTRANHHWRVVYPSDHLTDTSPKHSIILVNTRLDTNTWSQIQFNGTNDVTAIQIKHPQGRTTIFNIYNDCTHSDTTTALDNFLQNKHNTILRSATDSMLWCGNFNRHHSMWDEERNDHLFTAAATREVEGLISILAEHNMNMSLPRMLPTLQSMSTGNWTRVDNVFCTDNLTESITKYNTCPCL